MFNGTNRIIYDESMCFNIFKLIRANIHLNFDDDQSVKDYIIKCQGWYDKLSVNLHI